MRHLVLGLEERQTGSHEAVRAGAEEVRRLTDVGVERRQVVVRRIGVAAVDELPAKGLHLRGVRVCGGPPLVRRPVAPSGRRRHLARIAVDEVVDRVQTRTGEQLLGVRRARGELVAAADAHAIRRGPVEHRLVGVDAAGRGVVRVAVTELEVQARARPERAARRRSRTRRSRPPCCSTRTGSSAAR